MTIDALPTAPNRNMTPETFIATADAFVAALGILASQVNADLNLILNLSGLLSTSSTSVTIGTGSKSFTVETSKAYLAGQSVRVYSTASPANYMLGTVTSYDAGTGALVVNVTSVGGSGTLVAWTVVLAASGEWLGNATTATSATTAGSAGSSGTFNLTITGLASPPTVVAEWTLNNGVVHLHIPGGAVTGTSNSTQFYFDGLPAEIRPSANDVYFAGLWAADNGVQLGTALATVTSAGVMAIQKDTTGVSSWTSSGTKYLASSDFTWKI